jgi:hypothetical protein
MNLRMLGRGRENCSLPAVTPGTGENAYVAKAQEAAHRAARQLALGLLQDAMSNVEKGRSCPEAGYSEDAPSDVAHAVIVGVPGGLKIVEYVDAEHPYPIR